MNFRIISVVLFLSFFLVTSYAVYSQEWEFAKERDGIKIYTRKENNGSLKSFKGSADLKTEMSKVCSLLGNAKSFDWWDKDITEIKVISYELGKYIQYYLVYDVPWPLSDRDLVVDARITIDPVTGAETIFAQPLPNIIPEKPDLVRIKNYWQKWTVLPLSPGIVRVTLEGYVDPGGNVPAWLYNMVITDTPLKVIREVRKRVEVNPDK
jgi:hypothetical protein